MNLKLKKDWYSIVVYPQREVINDVKVLKDRLAAKIGWYASRNSEAHITVVTFLADRYEFGFYKKCIEKICCSQRPHKVIFDHVNVSKFSHAIVLLPNDSCKLYLKDLLNVFRERLKSKNTVNGANAHISIGRDLSSVQIDRAAHLYGNINLEFNCDTIAIRKLDKVKQQFVVINEFKLLGSPLNHYQYSLL
ncbi:hypothetical protein H9N25_06695 [Pedobacter riviphilus]|uniref:2'-5' RNA ligase n=1 Tax=Pedobacter riviphilus TaxID=2766984 RepID=A0ABX6TP12_9SPHI|nr:MULTISPECIES: hypothetical protein [Pedobacter]NII82323.1 hypothetical protein [Pedobacter sp. SG908]NMN36348.1 hypothetical protein [Pedobacter sp. SG918]QNR86105.1 hypothetical protein H9N25_06695 [Pedobacter riviphilus]